MGCPAGLPPCTHRVPSPTPLPHSPGLPPTAGQVLRRCSGDGADDPEFGTDSTCGGPRVCNESLPKHPSLPPPSMRRAERVQRVPPRHLSLPSPNVFVPYRCIGRLGTPARVRTHCAAWCAPRPLPPWGREGRAPCSWLLRVPRPSAPEGGRCARRAPEVVRAWATIGAREKMSLFRTWECPLVADQKCLVSSIGGSAPWPPTPPPMAGRARRAQCAWHGAPPAHPSHWVVGRGLHPVPGRV